MALPLKRPLHAASACQSRMQLQVSRPISSLIWHNRAFYMPLTAFITSTMLFESCKLQMLHAKAKVVSSSAWGATMHPVVFWRSKTCPPTRNITCLQHQTHADYQIAISVIKNAIVQLCGMLAAGSHLAGAAACSFPRSQQPKLLRNGPSTAANRVVQTSFKNVRRCAQVRAVTVTTCNALAHALPYGIWGVEAWVLLYF
jgi:hypothetical protein